MINRFLNSQTKTLTGAAGILAVSYAISGILGLLRDRLLAGAFGAGIETSIYFAAFRIPDLVYQILILGGIVFAFVPLFAEYSSKDKEKAWEMTNYILNIFVFLLALISFALFVLTPWLIKFIVPGFGPETRDLAVALTRILFLSPIVLGLSNIFSGVLQYFHRFLSYSLAPIFYNLGIIFGILFLSPSFGILGVAIGVIVGALLHLAIQIPSAFSCGFRYRFLFSLRYPAVKRIFILMIPRILGVVASQINLIIITAFASTIAAGSIAIFSFSNNLQSLPIGILGVSLATAAFPTFSRLWVNGQKSEFVEKFSLMLRQTLFLIIPISFLIFILRTQIVGLILGSGRFGLDAERLTAASLGLFSFGIFASTLIPVVARAFFSFQDTKTPALITLAVVAVNAALSFAFIRLFSFPNFIGGFFEKALKLQGLDNTAIVALPLAFSLAVISQCFLLLFFLYKKIGDYKIKDIFDSFKRILLASLVMGFFTWQSLGVVSLFLNSNTFWGIFWQAALSAFFGTFSYVLIAGVFKFQELKTIMLAIKQ